jgi:DNA-directed RNA polymerase specialized sigma24 family protein
MQTGSSSNKDPVPEGQRQLADALLAEFQSFIFALARQRAPRSVIPTEVLDLEINEIAQSTNLKFWQAVCRGPINNPRGYIHAIIRTEVADVVRRYRRMLPLLLNGDGELQPGTPAPLWSNEASDPADLVEQAESLAERIAHIAAAIRALPSRQREAILTTLYHTRKTHLRTDALPLLEALAHIGIEVQPLLTSPQKDERLRANASLHIARRKMRKQIERPPFSTAI